MKLLPHYGGKSFKPLLYTPIDEVCFQILNCFSLINLRFKMTFAEQPFTRKASPKIVLAVIICCV